MSAGVIAGIEPEERNLRTCAHYEMKRIGVAMGNFISVVDDPIDQSFPRVRISRKRTLSGVSRKTFKPSPQGIRWISLLEFPSNFVDGDFLRRQLKRTTLINELRQVLGCANEMKEEFLRKLLARVRVRSEPIAVN